jgi:polysaccharide export outer membrane protein
MTRWLVLCLSLAMLGGCESFPHDGPSIKAVREDAAHPDRHYSLVELDARSSAIVASVPPRELAGLGDVSSSARVDLVGVGDGLSVTVYERGVGSLFSQGVGQYGDDHAGANTIPLLFVDGSGDIALPFGGRVQVAGLTTAQAARVIERSLKGKAVNPQVVVNIAQNVSNSVTVMGEVRNPGRYPLAEGSDRLLDVVALAAGPTKPADDIRVEVSRGANTATGPLAQLLRDNLENVRLAPRDQVRLVFQPRKFSTFGALGHSAQIPMEDEKVTLAGALGRTGGLDANSADASSVLVFRFERPDVASALGLSAAPSPKGTPIIYHLNLRNPEGLFIADQFEVEPDDIIFVPRAGVAEARQFIDLVAAASSIAYNVRVTSVIP